MCQTIPGIHPGGAPGAAGASGSLEPVLGGLEGDVAVLAGVGLEPGEDGGVWDGLTLILFGHIWDVESAWVA